MRYWDTNAKCSFVGFCWVSFKSTGPLSSLSALFYTAVWLLYLFFFVVFAKQGMPAIVVAANCERENRSNTKREWRVHCGVCVIYILYVRSPTLTAHAHPKTMFNTHTLCQMVEKKRVCPAFLLSFDPFSGKLREILTRAYLLLLLGLLDFFWVPTNSLQVETFICAVGSVF